MGQNIPLTVENGIETIAKAKVGWVLHAPKCKTCFYNDHEEGHSLSVCRYNPSFLFDTYSGSICNHYKDEPLKHL